MTGIVDVIQHGGSDVGCKQSMLKPTSYPGSLSLSLLSPCRLEGKEREPENEVVT